MIFEVLQQNSMIDFIIISIFDFTNVMSISLFNTMLLFQNALPADSTFWGFYCGCGILFQGQSNFKDHVLDVHKGEKVQKSSHFVSQLSGAVLPDKKEYRLDSRQKVVSKNDQSIGSTGSKVSKLEQTSKQRIYEKSPKHQCKANESNLGQSLQTYFQQKQSQLHPKQERKKKKRLCLGVLNDFLLKSEGPPYGCGCCSKSFQKLQQLLQHCLYSNLQKKYLQEAKPTDEIETIICGHKSRRKKNRKARFCKAGFLEKQQFQPAVPYLFAHLKPVLVPSNMRKIFQIFAQLHQFSKGGLRKKQNPFLCGCGTGIMDGIKGGKTSNHLRQVHGDMMPHNSSHIIIRFKLPMSQYLLKVESQDDGLGWSCPCQPQKQMKRQTFVQHIRDVHKGISPQYVFYEKIKRTPPGL